MACSVKDCDWSKVTGDEFFCSQHREKWRNFCVAEGFNVPMSRKALKHSLGAFMNKDVIIEVS